MDFMIWCTSFVKIPHVSGKEGRNASCDPHTPSLLICYLLIYEMVEGIIFFPVNI